MAQPQSGRKCRRRVACLAAACALIARSRPAFSTPAVQTLSDTHGSYYLINNGQLQFQLYTTGALVGKVTSIVYSGQQMIGSKGLYDDIQGTPGIAFYNSSSLFNVRTGSNFVDVSMEQPATATQPLDATLHYILKDGDSGFSTYLTYHHTAAMADYAASENRFAEFFNDSLFHYSSITDKFWGFQAAGNADRGQGRFITAETSDMRGIPSEYAKAYETKYDWHDTHANEAGITGLVTAANTSAATASTAGTDYGVWNITNYRADEAWNGGPTQPQSVWADGASFIVCPAGSHQGGPQAVYTGNVDKAFGPYYTYFNTGANVDSMRADAKLQQASSSTNTFYDSLNLPYYASTAQRGSVTGQIRLGDGSNLTGATIVLSSFDATAYATDPISQEYQRRALGYNYWVTPNKDGTFNLPDVRPGNYRVTIVKPGNYREGTFDNITVSAGSATNAGKLTWTPDVSGHGVFQIGTFDRQSSEFKNGGDYNNWIDTNNANKEFPNGVNYTVNPANPFNDTTNWKNNWPLYQLNPSPDFYTVNFNLSSAPPTNSTYTLTISLAGQEFINDLGALVNGLTNRVDASFDHTADNASITYRSDNTSGRVMYRKLSFPGTWLHSGINSIQFHIVGGNMEWDAVRLDEQDAGTYSQSQWDGGIGNFSDASHWSTQQNGYTSSVASGAPANSTNTTFATGASHVAPINNSTSALYYDASINGGTVTLDTSSAVQKLSLLSGTLNVATGSPVLTVNDTLAFAGGNFNGSGTINALTTTAVNFDSSITGGAKLNSTGAVNWTDGNTSVTVSGAGSQWNTPGLSLGQSDLSTLSIASGGLVSTGAGKLNSGSGATVSIANATLNTAGIANAGTFNSSSSAILAGAGTFTNSGIATIDGGLSGSGVVNNAGKLVLSGTNTYAGSTIVNGGLLQAAAVSSIGGSGASITINSGGGVSFIPGITSAAFLARINPTSSGAFALTSVDSAAALNFTTAPLSAVAFMGIGAAENLTYTGTYTPAGGIYRLGGGGSTLTFSPIISGSSSVVIGNNGSTGSVVLNPANSYLGTTTIKGGALSVASLSNGGVASPVGQSSSAAGNLVLDGGTLQAAGNSNTDRLFTIGSNGATLDGSAGALSFSNTGPVGVSGSGNRSLTLAGTNISNSFGPAIVDPAGGTTNLIKSGIGKWTLNSNASTYSGDTTVLGGTLQLGPLATLPSGSGKGNLVVALGSTFEMNGQSLAINGLNDAPAGTAGPASANGNGGGTVDNNSGSKTLTIGVNGANAQFSGIISGGINLIKTGNGNQILSGDNTYTGTTTINAGILQIGVGGIPASYGPGDGGFRGKLGSGAVINNASLVFNRGYSTTCTNVITGTGSLKQTANAQLILGSANTYTGPTSIGQGIPNIGLGGPNDTGLAFTGDCSINAPVIANGGIASSIGASSNMAANLVLDGGTLFYTGGTATTDRLFTVTQNGGGIYANGGITFSNPGAIVFSGSGDRTLSLEGETTTSCTFGSDIGDPVSGHTSLTKDRSATWVLGTTAALTYTGNTNLNMGVLKTTVANQLPYGPGKGDVVFTTSTDFSSVYDPVLELNGFDQNIDGLSGGLATYGSVDNNVGTHTLTLGNNNATAEFAGVLTGGLNLVKTGSGTQTVDGVNTNTGSTTVNAGALIFSATSVIGGTGKNVSINNGATLGAPGTNLNQSFASRITTASSGVLALTSDDTNNLDFSAATGANLANVSLGALGTVTYSGVITPYSGNYQLGGGGGTLTVTTALTGSTNKLTIGEAGSTNGAVGTVILTGVNTYGGPTNILAGVGQFNSSAGIGGTGASVTISSGAVAAAGYAIDQAFLNRISNTSTGVVALAASSANTMDLTINNLSAITIGAIGSVTYTGTITPTGNGYRFGGGGGTLTLSNANALTGSASVTVGLGSVSPASIPNPLTLSNTAAQNYTGFTTIKTGGIIKGTVNNGLIAGAIGASSNAATNLVLDGGTLAAVGTTDRLFTLTNNGGTLDNTGGVSFSSSGAILLPASGNTLLTLTGSNTGHETFNALLGNPAGGITSILKSGTGKWTFSTANTKTYTGDTHVTAGVLETLLGNALSPNSNMVLDSGSFLDFHDSQPQSINALIGAGAVINSFSGTHTDTFNIGTANGSGTFTGTLGSSGTFILNKLGSGIQVFASSASFSGTTNVVGGQLTIDYPASFTCNTFTVSTGATLNVYGSVPSSAVLTDNGTTNFGPSQTPGLFTRTMGSIAVGNGGVVTVAAPASSANRTVLVTNSISFAGASNAWQSKLNLNSNDLVVHNGSLATLTNQLKQGFANGTWSGSGGIVCTSAAVDASHLTTLGCNSGGIAFDGMSTVNTDVLVKYTYYGDATLDGMVDGSDYSKIDNGYLTSASGWGNGDFNYDGIVNGSDYTLIDNAFNTQGAAIASQPAGLAAQLASQVTSQIAGGTSVPEPASLTLLSLLGAGLLGRRRTSLRTCYR